jgi:hypothetical protein
MKRWHTENERKTSYAEDEFEFLKNNLNQIITTDLSFFYAIGIRWIFIPDKEQSPSIEISFLQLFEKKRLEWYSNKRMIDDPLLKDLSSTKTKQKKKK